MIVVITWFDKHRLAVAEYFEKRKPAYMPDESWWVLLLGVHKIAGIASISCKSLQGHCSLLCSQRLTLNHLVLEINSKVAVVGSLSEVQRRAIDEVTNELSKSGEYAISLAALKGVVENKGFFVNDCLVAMDNASCDTLLPLSGNAILGLVDGISAIIAELSEDNEAYLDTAPSLLPISLSAFDPATSPTI